MKNVLAAGLAAGLFVAGIVAGALVVSGQPEQQSSVSLKPTTRKITLVAGENVVQVAPDGSLYQGGIMYHSMTFNGTIPGPLISANKGDTVEMMLYN